MVLQEKVGERDFRALAEPGEVPELQGSEVWMGGWRIRSLL